jgi:adenine phosphoribosyltransferase
MLNYQLTIGSQVRNLPLIAINNDTAIASFVLLGDDAMTRTAAKLLLPKLPAHFDYLVTVESKGIPLTHDLSLLAHHPRSFVIRKSVKGYMKNPITATVNSITTTHPQKLVLDGNDARQLQGKEVVLVDDVISTGSSMQSAEQLLQKINCHVCGRLAILAEGKAARRTDIQYLAPLPLFNFDGSVKEA